MYRTLCMLVWLLLINSIHLFAQETIMYQTDQLSFNYSDQWQLTESDSEIALSQDEFTLRLLMGEPMSGLPAGEFTRTKFIGQYGLPVDELIYEGKTKQVLYGLVETPDLSLTIVLDTQKTTIISSTTYEDVEIPRSIIDEASHIVSSLSFTNVEPREVIVTPFFDGTHHFIDDWKSYFHDDEPFGFRYPDTWTLTEESDRIILANDTAQFTIGFSSLTEDPPPISFNLLIRSSIDIRVPIYGMFQMIESSEISPQGDRALGVVYQGVTTSKNQFALWVEATSNALLDDKTMDEVDLIISTFKTVPPK